MSSFVIKAFSVFGAGVLASLSPCVYPMIPITVGYFGTQESRKRNLKIITFILGQALTLTVLAVVAVKTGRSIGFTSQSFWVNFFMGFLLLVGGIFSLKGRLPRFLERLNQKNKLTQTNQNNFLGALLLGVGTALLASPCTTPILSGIMLMLVESKTILQGISLMGFYSLGFSLLILLIALGALNLKSLPKNGAWMTKVHQLSALLLVGLGIFYFYKAFEIFTEF